MAKMKMQKNFLFTGIIMCLLLIVSVPIQAQKHYSEKQATEMLKSFYTEYFTALTKEPSQENYKELAAIRQKYCTLGLMRKIKRLQSQNELDYDPFINAQDSNIESLNTLIVKRNAQVINGYTVSYLDTYSGELVEIKLVVTSEKEKGSYKISSIL